MPAVSSSLEKIPQNPPISLALRPETIRHPDKRSKLENDATCGLNDLTTHRAVAAQMATGAGKTPTAIAIMQALPGPALVLAHRGELLDQTREKMAAFGIEPELEKAEARASLTAPVVLGSVQSLRNGRWEKFPFDHFKFIWIDECHHAPAVSYRNVLDRS